MAFRPRQAAPRSGIPALVTLRPDSRRRPAAGPGLRLRAAAGPAAGGAGPLPARRLARRLAATAARSRPASASNCGRIACGRPAPRWAGAPRSSRATSAARPCRRAR
ncbi:MAG: hypothetical protein MZW92_37860 [Comamonadaceae bacterium]|nr:hypothetical protein [Comamonadaceae bacterium]